jgi:hypothetical protein
MSRLLQRSRRQHELLHSELRGSLAAGLFGGGRQGVHLSVQLDGNDAAQKRTGLILFPRGASDIDNIIKDYGLCSHPWVDFYLTTILKVVAVKTDEGRVYTGGVKMKRGSFNNEFYNRDRYPVNNSRDCAAPFDHEQKLYNLPVTSAAKIVSGETLYIFCIRSDAIDGC